jgi:hypothetical protein
MNLGTVFKLMLCQFEQLHWKFEFSGRLGEPRGQVSRRHKKMHGCLERLGMLGSLENSFTSS